MKINGTIISDIIFTGSIYCLYSALTEKGNKKILLKVSNHTIPQKSIYKQFQNDFRNSQSVISDLVVKAMDFVDNGLEPAIMLEDFGGIPLETFTSIASFPFGDKMQIALF